MEDSEDGAGDGRFGEIMRFDHQRLEDGSRHSPLNNFVRHPHCWPHFPIATPGKGALQLVKWKAESPRKSKRRMSSPNGNHPTMYHRQPLGYGPAASPRQDLFTQKPYKTWPEAGMHLARIVYSTERTAIEGILPPGFHVQQGAEPTIMFEVLFLVQLCNLGDESRQFTLAGRSGI
jgi:hypothetical protein